MRYWLIMPAAGSGRRFGEALPKQYVPLAGRTVIEWALTPFLMDERCAGIVVAIAPDDAHWAEVQQRLPVVTHDAEMLEAAKGGAISGNSEAQSAHCEVSRDDEAQSAHGEASGDDEAQSVHGVVCPDGLGAKAAAGRDYALREHRPFIQIASGGAERGLSVLSALRALASVAAADDWVLVHDAARPCLPSSDLDALLHKLESHPVGGLLAARAADTLKRSGNSNEVEQTVDRNSLWRALTPQMFRYGALVEALDRAVQNKQTPTDEAQAIERMGQKPMLVEGSAANIKVTHARDLVLAEALLKGPQANTMRVGSGIDVHAFGPGDFVTLAGVRVPYTKGVVAHSDGDVILHALCDAMLGAAGLGDIGQHFRDDDPQWKGADSKQFVTAVLNMLKQRGMRVLNADVTVLAEAPRLSKYRPEMRRTLAELLEVDESRVNVKATTTERLGFIGRSEGLAAQAVVAVSE